MAYQCFRLALATNNDHAESYNNLGVLEYRRGNIETAKAFFTTAASIASHLFQPLYNHAFLAQKVSKRLNGISRTKEFQFNFLSRRRAIFRLAFWLYKKL